MHLGEIPQETELMQRLNDCLQLQQKNLSELADCMNRSAECKIIVEDACKCNKDLTTLFQCFESELLDAAEYTGRVMDHLYALIESDQWTEPNT